MGLALPVKAVIYLTVSIIACRGGEVAWAGSFGECGKSILATLDRLELMRGFAEGELPLKLAYQGEGADPRDSG